MTHLHAATPLPLLFHLIVHSQTHSLLLYHHLSSFSSSLSSYYSILLLPPSKIQLSSIFSTPFFQIFSSPPLCLWVTYQSSCSEPLKYKSGFIIHLPLSLNYLSFWEIQKKPLLIFPSSFPFIHLLHLLSLSIHQRCLLCHYFPTLLSSRTKKRPHELEFPHPPPALYLSVSLLLTLIITSVTVPMVIA